MKKIFLVGMSLQILLVGIDTAAAQRGGGLLTRLQQGAKGMLAQLPQQILAIGAAGVIACGSATLVGCEQGRQIVLDFTDTEDADPLDPAAGQYVTFYIGNVLHEGYWEVTPDGLLLIEVDDGFGKLVFIEHQPGYAIPDHPDIGAEVYMFGTVGNQQVERYGFVREVYDSGFYIIDIDQIFYVNTGVTTELYPVQTVLAHASVLLEDGGFAFVGDE